MTGIERLREFVGGISPVTVVCGVTRTSYDWEHMEEAWVLLRDFLADIADQIEREHNVSDREEHDAAAWVRGHGGLDHVKAEWLSRSNLKRQLEREQAKVERQQRHIEFVQGKCRERQGHIVELSKELAELRKVLSDYRDALGGMCERLGITDGTSLPEMPDVICEALDRRLMPEGYEWPRYEGGPLLRYGDSYIGNDGGNHRAWQIRFDSNANVHVLRGEDGDCFDRTTWDHFDKGERVRRPDVLASDGEPLEVGQTVRGVNGGAYRVTGIRNGKVFARHVGGSFGAEVESAGGEGLYRLRADRLTHAKPEIDSLERIEEDAENVAKLFDNFDADASEDIREIVRRCKALAERGK